jgi:hypothetical protein
MYPENKKSMAKMKLFWGFGWVRMLERNLKPLLENGFPYELLNSKRKEEQTDSLRRSIFEISSRSEFLRPPHLKGLSQMTREYFRVKEEIFLALALIIFAAFKRS